MNVVVEGASHIASFSFAFGYSMTKEKRVEVGEPPPEAVELMTVEVEEVVIVMFVPATME